MERLGQGAAQRLGISAGARSATATQANVQGTAGVTRSVATSTEEQTFTHSVGWRGGHPLGPGVTGAQVEAQSALRVSPTGSTGQWGEGAYAFEGPLAPNPNGGSSFEFRVPPQTGVERINVPGQPRPIIRLVPPAGESMVPIQILGNDFAPGALQQGRQLAQGIEGMLSPRVPFGYPSLRGDVTGITGNLGANSPRFFVGPSTPPDEKSPQVPSVGVSF
jgi:hypothetical protein